MSFVAHISIYTSANHCSGSIYRISNLSVASSGYDTIGCEQAYHSAIVCLNNNALIPTRKPGLSDKAGICKKPVLPLLTRMRMYLVTLLHRKSKLVAVEF